MSFFCGLSDDLNLETICRDEGCSIRGVHHKHKSVAARIASARRTQRAAWRLDSPDALDEAVDRATSRFYPVHFEEIWTAVKHDYGTCSERTMYRAIKRAVEAQRIVKLDLGLSFAGYIKPGRLARDVELLREIMLDWRGQGHVGTSRCVRPAWGSANLDAVLHTELL